MRGARQRYDRFLDVGIWLLFFALLIPAGLAGWAIGHTEKQRTRTVTISQQEAVAAERAALVLAPAFSNKGLGPLPHEDWQVAERYEG
jgi:hypothetical protein